MSELPRSLDLKKERLEICDRKFGGFFARSPSSSLRIFVWHPEGSLQKHCQLRSRDRIDLAFCPLKAESRDLQDEKSWEECSQPPFRCGREGRQKGVLWAAQSSLGIKFPFMHFRCLKEKSKLFVLVWFGYTLSTMHLEYVLFFPPLFSAMCSTLVFPVSRAIACTEGYDPKINAVLRQF